MDTGMKALKRCHIYPSKWTQSSSLRRTSSNWEWMLRTFFFPLFFVYLIPIYIVISISNSNKLIKRVNKHICPKDKCARFKLSFVSFIHKSAFYSFILNEYKCYAMTHGGYIIFECAGQWLFLLQKDVLDKSCL